MADADLVEGADGVQVETRVLVRYFAGAAAAAGTDEERLEVPAGATAADLVGALGQRHPELVRVLEVASLLVGEVAVRDRSQPLLAGSGAGAAEVLVDVLPPFAGG